jgi:hypothetical protein
MKKTYRAPATFAIQVHTYSLMDLYSHGKTTDGVADRTGSDEEIIIDNQGSDGIDADAKVMGLWDDDPWDSW